MQQANYDSYWSLWGKVVNRLGEAGDPRLVLVVTDVAGGPQGFLNLIRQQATGIDSLQDLAMPAGSNMFYMDNLLEHAGQTYVATMRRGNVFDSVLGAGRLVPSQVHNYLVQALQAFRDSSNAMVYLLSPNYATCPGRGSAAANGDFSKSYYRIDVSEAVSTLVVSPSYPARYDHIRPIWAPQYARKMSTPFSGAAAPPKSKSCTAQMVKNQVATCLVAFTTIVLGSIALVMSYEIGRRA